MVELREETGVERSLTERLVRSRLQWAGHIERMADDRLQKRAAELREQGRNSMQRTFVEGVGSVRYESTQQPGAVGEMEQGLGHLCDGEETWELSLGYTQDVG